MTIKLEKKGYQLSISGWAGQLGNHIIQLSGALNVAKNTQSRLTIPEHPLLRQREFDFLDPANDNSLEPVSGRFFFKYDCFGYPVQFDRDRRKIFQEHIYDLLVRRNFRTRVRDSFRRKGPDAVRPDTLVINIRSGRDIFRIDQSPQNDYMQPPLSFYKHVIENNGYDDCLIVTQADRMNPCVDGLRSWRPQIRVKTHLSVQDDLLTILGAKQLVMCHSTFSWCLALMSKNLTKLYQPASFQILGVGDFAIDTYFFENYIAPGEWTSSTEQLERMINHSTDDIRVTHRGAHTGESREPELSNFW